MSDGDLDDDGGGGGVGDGVGERLVIVALELRSEFEEERKEKRWLSNCQRAFDTAAPAPRGGPEDDACSPPAADSFTDPFTDLWVLLQCALR